MPLCDVAFLLVVCSIAMPTAFPEEGILDLLKLMPLHFSTSSASGRGVSSRLTMIVNIYNVHKCVVRLKCFYFVALMNLRRIRTKYRYCIHILAVFSRSLLPPPNMISKFYIYVLFQHFCATAITKCLRQVVPVWSKSQHIK